MKIFIEVLLSIFLHPIAMILMWLNLASRSDLPKGRRIIWFVVSIVWGLGPILYLLIEDGRFW
ncbi:MAG: hypothetical protein ABR584_05010 [Candidatus Baltobacteraceae bacterium]